MIGRGNGRVAQSESHGEYKSKLVLNANPDVVELREQVLFVFAPGPGGRHYFDAVTLSRTGRKTAYAYKPTHLLHKEDFLQKMQVVAWHVDRLRFAHETVLITELDHDPIAVHNAKMFASLRAADTQDVDPAVLQVISKMAGARRVREILADVGASAEAYRSILKLIFAGTLKTLKHERITPASYVQKAA